MQRLRKGSLTTLPVNSERQVEATATVSPGNPRNSDFFHAFGIAGAGPDVLR